MKTVALFGQTEKGAFKIPYVIKNITDLFEHLGNPPDNTQAIACAIQALMFQWDVLFFRVAEEGFSDIDYFSGFKYLKQMKKQTPIHALCLPGVGCPKIIEASVAVLKIHNSLLLTSERDLFDYLTSRQIPE